MDEFARAFGATDEISSRQKLKNENRDLKNRLAEAEERIRSLEARITSNLPQGLLADLPARQTPSAQVSNRVCERVWAVENGHEFSNPNVSARIGESGFENLT
eukprot:700917-Amorphochlora_amoeboformis.AAC.3